MALMIARVWHGSTRPADADRYVSHLRRNVFPELSAMAGFRGVQLFRRLREDSVDFVVTTTWESLDAIRRFAGPAAEAAVIAPEAQAILTSYDRRAVHYDVVLT
jgi:heme-degrading monooxygenase HmoA